jgi:hypothetical protein
LYLLKEEKNLGDRAYMIVFRAGSNNVAFAGWRKTGRALETWFMDFLYGGYFRLATCNIPRNTGRICLFRLWSNGVAAINFGVAKIGGVLKWFLSVTLGKALFYSYSQNTVLLNKWCHLTGSIDYYGGTLGPLIGLGITYVDGSYNEHIQIDQGNPVGSAVNRIDIGFPSTVNCRAATVYCDSFSWTVYSYHA